MFDERGNRDSGWGIGQKRGPPKYLIDYDPPLNRIGYGLNVLYKYDGLHAIYGWYELYDAVIILRFKLYEYAIFPK